MPIRLIFFFMAILVAFFGARMLFYGMGELYDDIRLQFRGRTGTVVNIAYRSDVGGGDVSFRGYDEQQLQEHMMVPDNVRAKLDRHDPITIRYLPREPSVHRLDGEKSGAIAFCLFGLFMIVSGIFMMRLFSGRRR